MSTYKLLFNYIKTLIPSAYRCTFGTQEENKENTIGIFFKGGTPQKRIINSGEYLHKTVSITFNINSKREYQAVEKCMEDLEKFRDFFTTVHDFNYREDGKDLTVLYTELFGDINQLGFNSVGIPTYSLNFIVHYI